MATKKSIYEMIHAVYATNVMRTNQTTGSIVPRAIVISKIRHVSSFTLKYRPKLIQPVRHTTGVISVPPEYKSKQLHLCGNKYCDTCKMFMSDGQVCYMK